MDTDSDNDGIADYIEAFDVNSDGIPEVSPTGVDTDNDGLDDAFEGSEIDDVDGDEGWNDPASRLVNTDGDAEPDFRDTDDDDDGIETLDEDLNEDGDYANDDSDADGIPNYLDSDLGVQTDGIEVFNVLTPNGDGVHDVLEIEGLEEYPNNTLRVYNRWGVSVFTTKAYGSNGNLFDGTSQGRVTVAADNKLPVGTYFYILDYEDRNGTMQTRSGYLYINR